MREPEVTTLSGAIDTAAASFSFSFSFSFLFDACGPYLFAN